LVSKSVLVRLIASVLAHDSELVSLSVLSELHPASCSCISTSLGLSWHAEVVLAEEVLRFGQWQLWLLFVDFLVFVPEALEIGGVSEIDGDSDYVAFFLIESVVLLLGSVIPNLAAAINHLLTLSRPPSAQSIRLAPSRIPRILLLNLKWILDLCILRLEVLDLLAIAPEI